MKKGLLVIGIFFSATGFAQKKQAVAKNIILAKGQEITITTTATQNAEMAMGMGMKSSAATTTKLNVLEAADKNYKITATLTKMVFSADMLGQQKNFDSDKKEDREGEFAQSVSLDKPKPAVVDKSTGNVTLEKEDTLPAVQDDNPFSGMMGSLVKSSDAVSISSAFLIIPENKKAGDKWTDSSIIEGIKTLNIYSIESIVKNIVTIALNSVITGSTSMEAQGTQFNVTMNSASTGKIIVDNNTSLVKKRTNNADVKSTIEMMGQSVPVTGTATTTTTYTEVK